MLDPWFIWRRYSWAINMFSSHKHLHNDLHLRPCPQNNFKTWSDPDKLSPCFYHWWLTHLYLYCSSRTAWRWQTYMHDLRHLKQDAVFRTSQLFWKLIARRPMFLLYEGEHVTFLLLSQFLQSGSYFNKFPFHLNFLEAWKNSVCWHWFIQSYI